ncbi:SDR family NAD(P)-dependent oxidoreductase [Nonomuraea sp. NPDC050556]|uniref:SDR family NAD(P)-dependent oxidoreductase n=1 Tax=Nonomuraea sp. NPDC050556 TaxID=3364369 RepID=UPI0037A71DBA
MTDQVVAVTGAASGIGRATVELFAERGAKVVAVDVAKRGLDDLAERDGVVSLVGDVAAEETNAELAALALRTFGRLDTVVLNAGIGGAGPLESPGAVERFDRILSVNVRGVVLGIRAALPALRASGGGSIVVTSSVSGLHGDPGTWAYNVSKAAVINLVRAAAIDYAVENIRVNAIAPGGTVTALTAGVIAHPTLGPAVTERIPQRRWADPREQAEVIWFLASPAASYVTGVTVPVDGGLTANSGLLLPPAVPGGEPR